MIPQEPRVGGRIAQLAGPGRIELIERALPEPHSGEARVRITATGICGTDVHGYLGRLDSFPQVLGHDAVGFVDAVGSGVAGNAITVGDRVTIDPTVSCGQCASCSSGRPYLCAAGGYLGMTTPGTMAGYITVPAAQLVPVEDTVSDHDATVLEPVAVALHLLERLGASTPAMPVEVIGGGPLGILLAQTLIAHGWKVAIHEPQDGRRELARRAGLTVRESPDDGIHEGAALIVETSAAAAGAATALRLAGPGSTVAIVGRAPFEIPIADILLRELTVLGVRSGHGHYRAAMELVASGAVRPSDVLTHRFAFADVAEALRSASDSPTDVLRAVVDLDHPVAS